MNTRVKNLLILGLGLVVAGGLLLYPAYRWSKTLRADMLADKARQAYDVGNFQIAFDHANSAALMNPDNVELGILRGKAGLKLDRRNPFPLWKDLLRAPEVTVDDLIELVNRLDEYRLYTEVNLVLPVLLEKDPTNLRGRELYLASLYREYRFAVVDRLAAKWLEEGADSWTIHSAYIEALLNYPSADKREEGMAHLRRLTERKDEVGLYAIRRILQMKLEPDAMRTYIERLENHSEAAPEDKILTLGWRYFREGSIGFNEAHRAVKKLIDLEDETERKRYFTWLSNMQKFDLLLEQLEEDVAMRDAELYRLFLNAMIEAGKASEVVELTLDTSAELPLSESSMLIIRSRALAAVGNMEELGKALDLAVRLSTLDDFPELERELARLQRWDNLGELYWRLMENRMTRMFAAGKLIFSTYYLNDETGLIKALGAIDITQFESDPKLQNFIAYLKLIYEPKSYLESAHVLEDLIAKHPNLYDFRIMLALCHTLQGNPEMTTRLLPMIPKELPSQQFRYLKVAHHIITHLGQDAESSRADMVGKIPFDDLLPRERALLLGTR